MRNNSDRLNLPDNDPAIAKVLSSKMEGDLKQKETLDMNFAIPTEFVALPSRGRFYPEEHPLCEQESVEIRFMTAKDEDILTSKSLLKQGIALEKFIDGIVVNKRIKSKDLLSGDKNAILVAARSTGFGPEYTTKVTCPNCSSTSQHTFDLSEISMKEDPDFEELGVSQTQDGTFLMTLPKSGLEVEFKLLSGREEMELVSFMDKREKRGLPQSPVTTQLSFIIVSVNGDRDRAKISNYVESLPSLDSRKLRDAYGKIVPNLNMKQEFSCSKCSYEEEVDIPITVDFFWSR